MTKRKTKIKKYALGDFVGDPKKASNLEAGIGMGAGLLGSVIGDNDFGATLSGAGAGIGVGSKLGTLVGGPLGGVIGSAAGGIIGGVSGLIGHNKQQDLIKQNKVRDLTLQQNAYNENFNANLDSNNENPYGSVGQFAEGGEVPKKGKPLNPADRLTALYAQNPHLAPTYDGTPDGQFITEHADGTMGRWGKDYNLLPNEVVPLPIDNTSRIQTSDKALGTDNTYNPARDRQINNNIPILKSPTGRNRYADGGDTQDNTINIEKGELLIDPQKGKILQEYKGINPLTGGLYQPHAKKGKDPIDNMTIADPGLFVITKKKAKTYKDAVDNNDSIAKDTILMNIRNHKIDVEGGLKSKKYARGGDLPSATGIGVNNLLDTPEWYGGTPVNATIPNPSYQIPSTPSDNTFGNILDTVGKYAPSLMNIGQGLFGNTYQQPLVAPITNPYKNKIISNLPQNINTQPIINEIYNNERVAANDLKNNTNSSAIYRANRTGLANSTSRQLGQVKMQAQEANNQVAGQRAGIYGQLGQEDMSAQERARQLNLGITDRNNAAKVNKQNILNTGISQLQQIGQNDKSNNQKQALDKYNLKLLSQIFPNLKYYNDFDPETLFKQLGR